MNQELLTTGLLTYVVFLFSTTCHEAAHAYVALRGGDSTAAEGGQVSLNPVPHIRREPFGMVVVPIVTLMSGGGMVGWASAPYNPEWQRQYPGRAALMALAGPATNFALVLISGVLLHIAIRREAYGNGGAMQGLMAILEICFRLNLILGIFNLLPFPPFDGFGVLGGLTAKSRALEEFRLRMRQFSIIGLLVGWLAIDRIFPPVLNIAMRLLVIG